jgi:hypothetical protein
MTETGTQIQVKFAFRNALGGVGTGVWFFGIQRHDDLTHAKMIQGQSSTSS